MRSAFCLVAFFAFAAVAHAVPAAPLPSISDDAVIQVKMSHSTMTCKEMMRMHQKMMGGKKMTCKEMMRMHQKMMGNHA